MNSAILGLYGVYLLLVAYRGNSSKFLTYVGQEGGYIPWIVAIMVLGVAYDSPKTRPFVAPFASLLIISVLVSSKMDVVGQTKAAYSFLTGNGVKAS